MMTGCSLHQAVTVEAGRLTVAHDKNPEVLRVTKIHAISGKDTKGCFVVPVNHIVLKCELKGTCG